MNPLHSPIDEMQAKQKVVVLDGAMATELERRGADLHDALWSAKVLIESPEMIRDVHMGYLRAGADVISTASYQATIDGFMSRGFTRTESQDLIRLSVQLAIDARDEFWADAEHRVGRVKPAVAASIGPYGAYLADGSEYSGDYGLTDEELIEFHRPRVDILANTDVDILAFETIPCLQEGRAIIQLLAEYPQASAWLAFSCRDGEQTNHGELMVHCARMADASKQIVAVGVNCTAPRYIESLITGARRGTDKPIVVYPNSGESYDAQQGCWVEGTGDGSIADGVAEWLAAGASLIGGCCRTTPHDITLIRDALIARH